MHGLATGERGLSLVALLLALAGIGVALTDTAGSVGPHLTVALVPFILRAVTTRFPAWAVLATTTVAVVHLNLDLSAQGAFLLPLTAALVVTATDAHRVRAAVAVALAALAPPVTWIIGQGRSGDWNWPYWSMGIVITAVMGALLHRQRTLTEELAVARLRLADQAVAEERRRIARDVHDLVGHSLSVVLLHVVGARHKLHRDPDDADEALGEAERVGRASLAEVRHAVGFLRASDGGRTDPTPNLGDVAELVDRYRSAGLAADLRVDGDLTAVDAVTGLAAYRIVQESLTNVVRHAVGTTVSVEVAVTGTSTTVSVTNSAPQQAPVPTRSTGYGIAGMQERARALGGAVTAGPQPGGGWAVRARLPRASAAVALGEIGARP